MIKQKSKHKIYVIAVLFLSFYEQIS